MILSDRDIRASMEQPNGIRVDHMAEGAIGPSSVDLRLQNEFLCYKIGDEEIDPLVGVDPTHLHRTWSPWLILPPGQSVLGSTVERVYVPTNMAGRVEGKSSLGRLFLSVHETAGFIDAGNYLSITLEIKNNNHARPIILRAGMWIAQITFEMLSTECEVPYNKRKGSRYLGDTTTQASRIEMNPGVFGD